MGAGTGDELGLEPEDASAVAVASSARTRDAEVETMRRTATMTDETNEEINFCFMMLYFFLG